MSLLQVICTWIYDKSNFLLYYYNYKSYICNIFIGYKPTQIWIELGCEVYLVKREFEQEYKKIGLKIAYYRKLQGYTQERLAEKLGVATSYIGQIKAAGMYKPISLTTLLRIAQALDTPAYKFLEF